eukprot:gene18729-22366_t
MMDGVQPQAQADLTQRLAATEQRHSTRDSTGPSAALAAEADGATAGSHSLRSVTREAAPHQSRPAQEDMASRKKAGLAAAVEVLQRDGELATTGILAEPSHRDLDGRDWLRPPSVRV